MLLEGDLLLTHVIKLHTFVLIHVGDLHALLLVAQQRLPPVLLDFVHFLLLEGLLGRYLGLLGVVVGVILVADIRLYLPIHYIAFSTVHSFIFNFNYS